MPIPSIPIPNNSVDTNTREGWCWYTPNSNSFGSLILALVPLDKIYSSNTEIPGIVVAILTLNINFLILVFH